ncbi:MAG: hypothetical protein WC616_01560 [Candidatus Omnitrophota bacterium]
MNYQEMYEQAAKEIRRLYRVCSDYGNVIEKLRADMNGLTAHVDSMKETLTFTG